MNKENIIKWEQDENNIVTLTINDPKQNVNTMNKAFNYSFSETVQKITTNLTEIAGIILTSGKNTFFAGGDLNLISQTYATDIQELIDYITGFKSTLRQLELLTIPVVAAINGSALGGGLELALGCNYRISLNDPKIKLGLPEVTLGLIPGGGGITRLVRLLGIQSALPEILLTGKRYSPAKALELGLIHQLVVDETELVTAAKKYILAHPEVRQPWDTENYRLPGGKPSNPSLAANLPAFPANLRKQLKGAPYPAPIAIMSAAVEGAQLDFAQASLIETRYFAKVATGQIAKNMTKAFFFDLQHLNTGGSRPKNQPQTRINTVGIVGAGMMGSAIAYVCAKAGISVLLTDTNLTKAEQGKDFSKKLAPTDSALLEKITPTDNYGDFAKADLIIEAVFEDVHLKQKILQTIENSTTTATLIGSNTSTLPISTLADGLTKADRFIGIHFFSPVNKMPLIEIIKGKNTSEKTLAAALDFALQIHKTPIVVNDSRGFFTSRVISSYLTEAIAAVGEGVEPQRIEQAALQAGYPTGPLQLTDELTLTLAQSIRQQTLLATEATSTNTVEATTADKVINLLVEKYHRLGKSSGAGFYDYTSEGKRISLWPELKKLFNSGSSSSALTELQERMLFIEAIESAKCLAEGVITSLPDANIGSIFGIGFPAWTGGVIQYIIQYPGGIKAFMQKSHQLADKYGPQFLPPANLAELITKS